MFKKILVAVDGSEHALRAAEVAAELAARNQGRLVILTVAKPLRTMSPSVRDYIQAEHMVGEPQYVLSDMARSALTQAEHKARDHGVTAIKTAVREGPPARRIVEYAREHDIDTIVMGSRGLGDVEGLLLGSVSHKVTTLAHCTCVTVK